MILGNILVFIFYALVVVVVFYYFKNSLTPLEERNRAANSLTSANYDAKESVLLTISKYMLVRYTAFAVTLPNKKYAVCQFLSLALYSVTALQINKLVIWPIGLSIASFSVTLLLHQFGPLIVQYLRSRSSGKKEVETRIETGVQSKKPMQIEDWSIMFLVWVAGWLQMAAALRIAYSKSNLGELNIGSSLVCLLIEQVVLRPIYSCVVAGFLCALRQINLLRNSALIENMLVCEYVRCGVEERVLPAVSTSPKKDISVATPSRITKDNCQLPDETATYMDLIRQRSSHRKKEPQMRVQDIGLEEKYVIEPIDKQDDESSQPYTDIKLELEHKLDLEPEPEDDAEPTDESDMCNKENELDTIDAHYLASQAKEKRANNFNDDLYLAQNFCPSKNEHTVPITITLSPIKQTRKKPRKRNNRVLLLSGNSPYLEYLPNMLKKQESQNKLRNLAKQQQNKDKSNVSIRMDTMKSHLKNIRS